MTLLVFFLINIAYPTFGVKLNISPTEVAVVSYEFPYRNEPDNKIKASCTDRSGTRTYMKYNLTDLGIDTEMAILWVNKEEQNNYAVLRLGFYYIEDDGWNSDISWNTQPCESVWPMNSKCQITPFYNYKTSEKVGVWESFNLTDVLRMEDDKVFSFVLKTVGKDKLCEIDQFISYGKNSFIEIDGCIPNWVMNDSLCELNDMKFAYYTDTRNCNSSYNLPRDNGTYIKCDYCLPNWTELITSCEPNDTMVGYFIDVNDCYSKTQLESDLVDPENKTYFCDYCLSEWTLNDTWGECQIGCTQYKNYYDIKECFGTELPPIPISRQCNYSHEEYVDIEAGKIFILDIKKEANISLDMMASRNITNGNVNITSYPESPVNSSFGIVEFGNFIDVSLNPAILEDMKWVMIKIYYTDEDVSESGVSERELRIYTFNEADSKWKKVSDSGVDTTLNYVWANVTHFSLYGIFENKEYCGDEVCNNNETYISCSEDCIQQTTATVPVSGRTMLTTTTTTSSTSITLLSTSTTSTISVFSTSTTSINPTTSTIKEESLFPTGNIIRTTGKFLSGNVNAMILTMSLFIVLFSVIILSPLRKKIMGLVKKQNMH